jgi:hypothetical protein
MNVEKNLLKDGIIVTEKIDTETVLNITNSISKKIVATFPEFGLDADEIFSKLFSLNMYKAQMPDGMAEANYCYKNSSIYFNSHIANEDLEEFAIHECLHFLQEVKDENNNITKMGLSNYSKFKTVGTGLNEAAVQYISAKIIGIKPDFEKFYDINIYTPSPSYYPVECALLNELIFFVGEDVLFKSTYFSTDDFKNEIIKLTSKKVFDKILCSFDNILKYEEQIIILNNKIFETNKAEKLQNDVIKYREKINSTFIEAQNLIIKEFFDSEYNDIRDLEQLENYRRKLTKFEHLIGTTDNYTFFENYYIEMMNKLEHKSNVLENGGLETAIENKSFSVFDLLNKIKDLIFSKNVHEK